MSDSQDWSAKGADGTSAPAKRWLWWVLGCTGALLLGMVVLGVLATIVVPQMFGGRQHRAFVSAAKVDIAELETMLERERVRTGAYPRSLEELNLPGGPLEGQVLPEDPWGHPYVYTPPTTPREKPVVMSYGVDGAPGGKGLGADITSR